MKLQIFILTLGIVASAGAVEVQLNRSAVGAATSEVIPTPIAASKSITTVSTGLLSRAKPSITGIAASEENDN
jgi:hypothetical protein